jgi:peptidoglycan-associated lipoprotein
MCLGIKRLFILLVFIALPLVFGGCRKTPAPTYPLCKTNADCRMDASGKEINAVCYMGKCEECIEDIDCQDLKQCVNNRCIAVCETDADCGINEHCEAGYCMEDCLNDEFCPGDQICQQGRCVEQPMVEEEIVLESECDNMAPVYFDFDRYEEVKSEYYEQISRLATCLNENPSYRVLLEGHTDNRGTPSYNMALGQKRADTVKNYLMEKLGIALARVRTLSYGEEKPAINENNEYAWQQNRRVEIIIEKD